MKLRIAFAAIGLGVGILVAFMFIWEYDNLNAGLWGLISGTFTVMDNKILHVCLF
jgi:hypothetical protein